MTAPLRKDAPSGVIRSIAEPWEEGPPPGRFEDDLNRARVIETIGLREIAKPLPPVPWLVEALGIAPGAAVCVAGYGYAKKTIAIQSAELALIAGKPIWGVHRCRRGRVLHVDFEQGRRLTVERYQRLARGMAIDFAALDDDALRLAVMPDVYLDSPDAADVYARTMQGFDLTVVDSLRAAAPGADENSSEVRRHIDVLTRACEKTGGAALFIHHARKPTDDSGGAARTAIRGSSAIFDAAASVFVFVGDKDKPTRVHHEKDRIRGLTVDDFGLDVADVEIDGEPRAGVRVVHLDGDQLTEALDGTDGEVRRYEALREKVLATVVANPSLDGANAVWRTMKGSRPAVLAMVKDLLREGALRKEGGCLRIA